MVLVAERISDGSMLRLIRMWLKAPVMEQDEDGTKRHIGGGKGNRQGTPQGGVISPLLSNIYLHLIDRIWQRRQLQQQLGARIVRYADDIVILCRQGTKRPMAALQDMLGRMDLRLNETQDPSGQRPPRDVQLPRLRDWVMEESQERQDLYPGSALQGIR